MQNTQLVQLLKILTAKELKQFKAYLHKLDRPSNKLAIKLFLKLNKYAPHYDTPKLDRSKIAHYLFDSKDIQALNKIAFTLKTILEEFLVFLEIENNSLLKQQLLLKALKDRNHPSYSKRSKQLIETIQNSTDKEVDHLTLFQLNAALSSDANTAKIGSDLQELYAANQHLDQFYFYHKLKIILEHNLSEKINSLTWSIEQGVELIEIVKEHTTLKKDPTIGLLLLAIQLIATPQKENYLQMKASLFREAHQLSKKDMQDFFITLTVYYNQLLSTDVSFYTQEGFELYKFADQLDLLVINGRIRAVEYTNAASVGFNTKNEEWTHDFIQRNKKFLAPNIRSALYAYVRAVNYFRKGAFDEVIVLLYPFNNNATLALDTNILIRTLLIRTNFELCDQKEISSKEQQFLLSLSKRFKRFLNSSQQLSSKKTTSYLQFLHFFDQLVKLQNASNSKKVKMLKKEIDENMTVALKGWLQSKLIAV